MGMYNTMLVAIAVTVSVAFVTEALAQSQAPPPAGQRPPGVETPAAGEEKTVEGQVKSVDPSGTEITLTDGTTLVTPPGAVIRPGVLPEGSMVVASYKEEDGKRVLTGLLLKEPATSPPPAPRSPGEPPRGAPTR